MGHDVVLSQQEYSLLFYTVRQHLYTLKYLALGHETSAIEGFFIAEKIRYLEELAKKLQDGTPYFALGEIYNIRSD